MVHSAPTMAPHGSINANGHSYHNINGAASWVPVPWVGNPSGFVGGYSTYGTGTGNCSSGIISIGPVDPEPNCFTQVDGLVAKDYCGNEDQCKNKADGWITTECLFCKYSLKVDMPALFDRRAVVKKLREL